LVPVASGVYAFVAHQSRTAIVSGNSVVVLGEDSALVVDTGQFPALARREIDELRRLTDKPVRFVVNTHWHNDHIFGNAAFRDAYQGVRFLAHEDTRRLVLEKGPKQVDTYRNKVAPFVERLRGQLRDGKSQEGAPLDAAGRDHLIELIADGDAAIPLWRDVELVPPVETFGDEMIVDLGRRKVKLLHFGRGNTAGDAMVHVPDVDVLATGDVLVAPTPYAIGSYVGEWTRVLRRVKAMGAGTLIPGHGPVAHDARYVDLVIEALETLTAQVKAAHAAGLSLAETRKKVDLSTVRRRFTGGDADLDRAFTEALETPGVERAYQEASGQLAGE
jgi:glyoxylase-like metal-dependent hydrolase (beta-lactamase superfamily II)